MRLDVEFCEENASLSPSFCEEEKAVEINMEGGIKGDPGKDGTTPHIGDNRHWYIDDVDTGIKAEGVDGIDGVTPHIGDNKHWYIGDIDTGITAEGKDGRDGRDGRDGTDGVDGITPHIGSNMHWYIGTIDTGIKAEGTDGQDGVDGEDGISMVSGTIDQRGHLIVTMSDGSTIDCGETKGEKGDTGNSGVTVSSSEPTDPTVNVWIDTTGQPDTYNKDEVDAKLDLKADTSDIPTAVSELTNDSGYLTLSTLPIWEGGLTDVD